MPLRPGDLRQRVTIQEVSETLNAGGGKTKAWNDVATVWAQVTPSSGGEAFAQGVARNTQFYKVLIRYRAGVTPRNRMVWNGQPLNIRTCSDPDGTREALQMMAESGSPEPA
ncbi:phage head closure protein [Sphingomonas bacterium]|uniref:phage head closure protein n=1 Tax=Sphingomonas bacterium TaxID=1895847 RepID=UPI00157503B4|nr:phage head closure protein [Sphingomonas bacterium]